MRGIYLNTFAMDGIVLWLGITLTSATICIIGMVHEKARRLDWFLATAICTLQIMLCLVFLGKQCVDLAHLFMDYPDIAIKQFLVDMISLAVIVPILFSLFLAAKKFALARIKEKKSIACAGILAGESIAEDVMSFKEELASIRRMELYEDVEDELL